MEGTDESEDSDTTHGGGQVPAVLVSPLAKAGYQSTTLYQHNSTLKLMMEGLGVSDLPGAAAERILQVSLIGNSRAKGCPYRRAMANTVG
jgi:hypothetical protein